MRLNALSHYYPDSLAFTFLHLLNSLGSIQCLRQPISAPHYFTLHSAFSASRVPVLTHG